VANSIPPVLIELQLETAKIASQMNQLTGDFQNFGKTVEKQTGFMANFKAAAAGVFAGDLMTSGLNMLKTGIQSAILDAQEYEKVSAQLAAGIASTGNAAGLSVEGLQAQASALEKLSAVDENLIIQSQAVFQTFTNIRNVAGENNDIFNQASQSALDLSVKMGGDLQGATVQLGKALNDPIKGITALTRVGVVFTDAQKAQIKALQESGDMMGAQKIILAEMNTEFGGAAKAAGDTFAGAVFRAKDKVADFAREFITNLQPILLKIGKTIGDLYTKYLAPLLSFINRNKEALGLFVAIIGTAVVAFKVYHAVMAIGTTISSLYLVATTLLRGAKLIDVVATDQQTRAMVMLNAVMNANPIALVVLLLAALAAGFVYAWNNSESFRKIMISVGKAGLTALAFIIEQVGNLAVGVLKVVTGPMRLLLKGLDMLGVAGAGEALKDINGAIDSVGKFFDGAAKKVESYKKTLDGLADKKIKLPSFGAPPKVPTGEEGGAAAPGSGGALTADQLKKIKADADKTKATLKKLNEDVKKSYADMNKVIAESAEKRSEIQANYDETILELHARHAERKLEITADYEEDIASALTSYEEDKVQIAKRYAQDTERALKAHNDAKERIAKTYEDSTARALQTYNKSKEKIAKNYQDTVTKALKDFNDRNQKISEDYANKAVKLEESATQKRASIIEKGRALLTNAFESGTKTDLAKMFQDSDKSGAGLAAAMKNKLAKIVELQQNAGKLASLGYTQTFIQQIVASGTDTGNAMAQAILQATPDTQAQLKDLYGAMEDTSKNGLNGLASQMSTSTSFATEELLNEYQQVGADLNTALADNQTSLTAALGDSQSKYSEALTSAASSRMEALAEAKASYSEAMADAAKAQQEALAEAQKNYNEAMTEAAKAQTEALAEAKKNYDEAVAKAAKAQADALTKIKKDLEKSLLDAAKIFNDQIDKLNKATIKKLNELQAALVKTASMITTLGGAKAGVKALAGSPMAGILSGTGAQSANTEVATITNYYQTDITGVNLTDPNQTATVVKNAVLFGQTQGLATDGDFITINGRVGR